MARKVKRVKHHVKKTKTTVHKRGAGKKSGGSLRSIFSGW